MKILVTGSSGFLGNALRHHLINEGYDTYGTTRSRPPEDKKEFQFDITKDNCRQTFNNIKFDVIIHAIGLTDESAPYWLLKQTNVYGTKKIIQYAKVINCQHFIYLSSVSVYGIRILGQNRTENSTKISPHSYISKYGMTKAQAELEVVKAEIPYTVLRLPLMIGKGDKMVSPKLVDLLKNNKIFYLGNGTKLISIMPVENLLALVSILVKKGALNRSLHTPSFHISLNKFVKEHSLLDNLPLQIRKGFIQIFLINLPNIRKILLFYSWRGAHFKDSEIRSLIPEYHDIVSWKTALQDNFLKN
jgi:nucleoside-diphosphate-sugar epimerase